MVNRRKNMPPMNDGAKEAAPVSFVDVRITELITSALMDHSNTTLGSMKIFVSVVMSV